MSIIKYLQHCIILSVICLYALTMQGMQKVPGIPKTHLFVLHTIKSAYPELHDRTIVVRENMRDDRFGAGYLIMRGKEYDAIDVPFTKAELLRAQEFMQDDGVISTDELCERLCSLEYENIALQIDQHRNNPNVQKLFVPKVFSLLEDHGFACRSSTLGLWQGILLHEGAHLMYHDVKESGLSEPLEHLKQIEKPAKGTVIDLLEQIMPAYKKNCMMEYRADQESIKRTQSVAVLRALSTFHLDHGFWRQLFSVRSQKSVSLKLDELFAPHQDGFTRAKYFAQAADALERRLQRKS